TEPGAQPALPDHRHDQNQGSAQGGGMSIVSVAALQPPTYPARPLNGGPLELAPPKPGPWSYEPKYNGWRALVHAPTGSMFQKLAFRLGTQAI
ncbi:MAG: hypothetical protein NT154_33550, partial [Verrucomicrobia bacterium]|nr:hypothetical protein [Verrucomicrobiota bacterium]